MAPKKARDLTEKHIYTEIAESERSGDSAPHDLGPDEEGFDAEESERRSGTGSQDGEPQDPSQLGPHSHRTSGSDHSGSSSLASSSRRGSSVQSSAVHHSESRASTVAEMDDIADTTPLLPVVQPKSMAHSRYGAKSKARPTRPLESEEAGEEEEEEPQSSFFCSWRCYLPIVLLLILGPSIAYVVKMEECAISPWEPWGPCEPTIAGYLPCGPGRRKRTRRILGGRCGEPTLLEVGDCDMGECRLPDYIAVAQERKCDADARKAILRHAHDVVAPEEWLALRSCSRAYLCCHSCSDGYALSGPLSCSGRTLPPLAFNTSDGACLSCFPAGPGPGCRGGKPFCRRFFTSDEGRTAPLCCAAVGPQHRLAGAGDEQKGTPPPDVQNFERRPGSNAFLGVLRGPSSWPTAPDEAACQKRCWQDVECRLYVYVSPAAAIKRWRGRCVTWDQETAEEQGRAELETWIPEFGVYSGLKAHIRYSDVVITIRTAEGADSGSTGPFDVYVCRSRHNCQVQSPIRLTSGSCTVGLDCLSPGTTAHFVGTVVVPKDFELHAVRVQGHTKDAWSLVEMIVDCEGELGVYRGAVTLSDGEAWTITVGCVTSAGFHTTAQPGLPCVSPCYSGYGPYGWCWADKDETEWGDCSSNCLKTGKRRSPEAAMTESAVSCAELNWRTWSSFNNNRSVCGASNDWPLRGCSGPLAWDAAKEFCELIGARLCTSDELRADETAGTGCDLDRQHVWSATRCEGEGYLVLPGSSHYLKQVGPRCTRKESTSASARCCADARKIEIHFKVSHRNSHVMPWHMHRGSAPGLSNWQVVRGTNWKGEEDFFLQSGMLDDQLPFDSTSVDVYLKDVPVSTLGGEVEFYFRLNSEPGWDKLHFYIDGVEETRSGFPVSGHVDWTLARFSFPARQGTELHTFMWRFSKDRSDTAGEDVASIDKITVYDVLSVD